MYKRGRPQGVALAALLVWSWAGAVWGQDPTELEGQVRAAEAEVASLRAQLAEQQRTAEQFAGELEQLREQAPGLEQVRKEALAAMDAQYKRIVQDPSLELTETRNAYRLAIAARERLQDAVAAKQQEIARQRGEIEASQRAATEAARALAQMRRGYDAARVARLQRELTVTDGITIANTVTCDRAETIAECIERGNRKAEEVALAAFADRLFASSTEAEIVKPRRGDASPELSLVDSRVENSGFQGQGDYRVELLARVSSRVDRTQACRLLGLTDEQCGPAPAADEATAARRGGVAEAPAAPVAAETPATDDAEPAGPGPYMLTVRSNVYYDEVYIDGVSYGSTRLDVMLPAGEYAVEVRKPGYSSWSGRVRLNGAATVLAELEEQ